jgi:hypothetical protein
MAVIVAPPPPRPFSQHLFAAADTNMSVVKNALGGVAIFSVVGGLAAKTMYDLIDRNMDEETFGWEDIAVTMGATPRPPPVQKKKKVVYRKRAELLSVSPDTEAKARAFHDLCYAWMQYGLPGGIGFGAVSGYQCSTLLEARGPEPVAHALRTYKSTLGFASRYLVPTRTEGPCRVAWRAVLAPNSV